jgi:AraC-like DNA-binding protein
MECIFLPYQEFYKYAFTGKFKALNDKWQHERCCLREYELFVVTEGTLFLQYNRKKYTVHEGEYLLLPPTNTFREGYKKAYSSFYWLHFEARPINPEDELSIRIPVYGKLPAPGKITVLMKQLQDIVKNSYPRISLDTMTTNVITELYGQLEVIKNVTPSRDKKQIYLDIIDYIQTNLSGDLSIEHIATEFGYNPRYLSHLFTQLCGIPLKQFILNQKVDAANFMLSDNNTSITDIALKLGFSDVHNFSRTYKKLTGMTPSEYRNAFAKRLLYHV